LRADRAGLHRRARRERARGRERRRRRGPRPARHPPELRPRARSDPLPQGARHARGDRRTRRGPLRPRARPRAPAAGRAPRLPRRGLAGAAGSPLMRRRVLAAAAPVALAVALAALPIGSDVYEGGEAREGLVVREMLRTGDWILPLWNGTVVP